MDTYTQDSSGIFSLGGFSFQMRVFVYYMLTLKKGMQIEFETIDDVNIRKLKHQEIDKYDDNFVSKIVGNDTNVAVQVKRTSITESSVLKVLLNWIILESSENAISKYILFTHDEYKNSDILFSKSAEEQYEIIRKSTKGSKALITKVKKMYTDFESFEKRFNSIKSKYEFISINDMDEKIDENCSEHFRKAGINKVVYYDRIKELLKHVTVQIMESINRKKPYILSYPDFIKLIEDICSRMTEQITLPHYSDFKKLHSVDFNDLSIANSREYKQLLACNLPQPLIKIHLGYGEYYKDLRFRYMETNKLANIENIEETTYENYIISKHKLEIEGRDFPYNRFQETMNRSNTFAENDQIRFGSGIYLTKNEIENNQISWEDEENETT
ncbi:hypothetical protein [Paenibacillus sp. OK076]|uniref:hypothetical protein n=1 Tax=Paenibacillus sp. OK076 TaxID=1884379 RepID=UPI0008C33F06|nr:hypothetical protein [Paenibacillus sp. OK076]SEO05715.1 hypothetical protein SAMN05518670_3494 [Paenibacillus sp. OK076]